MLVIRACRYASVLLALNKARDVLDGSAAPLSADGGCETNVSGAKRPLQRRESDDARYRDTCCQVDRLACRQRAVYIHRDSRMQGSKA